MYELVFRPARFSGFVATPERDFDTKWFDDRGGAVTRARVLQQTHTKITIIQRADTKWQVLFSRPVPHPTTFPFEDTLLRDTKAGVERRARVLRAYGFVVTTSQRAVDNKFVCTITRLVGKKPALPTATGIDVGFFYDRKDSAQRRADALAEVGFGVTVFERADKNWQVKITKLPTYPAPTASGTTTATPPATTPPASPLPNKLVKVTAGDAHELSDAVVQSFRDFAKDVLDATGQSIDTNFGDTVRPIGAAGIASKGSDPFSWHKTGRAVDIDQALKWVIIKDPSSTGMQFRIYLRHKDDKATAGVKKFPSGTTFYKAYWSDVRPTWPFVDVTAIAARHGWTRIDAQTGYGLTGTAYNKLEFWHFEKRDGLTWLQAMQQIYTTAKITAAVKSLAGSSPNRYGERLHKREGFDAAAMATIFPKVKKGAVELRCPVGKGGANLPSDVRAVQDALIKATLLPAGSSSGIVDAATQTAIEAFQRRFGSADGLISVGLGTHKQLGKL